MVHDLRFMLNLPRHRHRLLLTTRTDPLDIGYTNASSENLASADTVVPRIASGQKATCLLLVYKNFTVIYG